MPFFSLVWLWVQWNMCIKCWSH